ncbi:UNVERIFIED_CONTAM: Serrate RNA effector molecule [Sesamum radiatum]|uniref:Serrate RNA effector molecule n=1 Tax=Sesamum radiatum TaxID=300843 RepID=A0AAW2W769_SESRA
MAEVATATEENLDRRRERSTTTDPDNNDKPSDTAPSDAGPDATSSPPPPPPPPRRGIRDRERDSRERRDDRDFDRPPRRTMTAIDRLRRRRHAKGIITNGFRVPFLPSKWAILTLVFWFRFGYDYPGGYEREMGGRPGYPDERPHGRHMGRSGGYQDWDSGRGAFADAFNAGGAQREGMMSYKQFIQELEDDILPAEAERRYQEYRTEYISTQKRTYFNAHKDEECDENAPGGTPVMQPSFPKEKPQRRRPGLDNRLKDERGNRRERDNRTNGNERFDRSENPQSGDFANNDGASGNNPDEPMFDSFGGQGIPVAAFASDIPPPVLMPVPGAGPLGPFVPAPPEVAMRMLRDQGGPPPFEGGRNGRSGPQLAGPSPIIALPPTLRQDPRRLRSYNNLDAPDDEVTVIDYRSL